MLYSFKNQYPEPLPFRVRLDDGSTRTDLVSYPESELNLFGFVKVQEKPAIDEFQDLIWDGVNWAVLPKSQEEINSILQNKVDLLVSEIERRAQKRLDDFAKTRRYEGILSLCTYATDPDPKLSAEGQYGVTKRSETWTKLYKIMDDVMSGLRPIPASYEEIEPELPILEWPV